MMISYVKLFRADDGTVLDTQEANGEIRQLNHRIAVLKEALEIEMDNVTDLRELLAEVRKLAYDLNEEILKDRE